MYCINLAIDKTEQLLSLGETEEEKMGHLAGAGASQMLGNELESRLWFILVREIEREVLSKDKSRMKGKNANFGKMKDDVSP